MTERIVAAALRYRRVTYSVPPPGRHHSVMRLMSEKGLGTEAMHNQGFVTSTGRFVNRCEAFKIATEAGQIIKKTGNPNSQDLYSEDVW